MASWVDEAAAGRIPFLKKTQRWTPRCDTVVLITLPTGSVAKNAHDQCFKLCLIYRKVVSENAKS